MFQLPDTNGGVDERFDPVQALLLFNMIPVPPLDGHYVLDYFLPPAGQQVLRQIGPFGILIAIMLVSGLGILGPPMRFMMGVIQFVGFAGTGIDTLAGL